MKIAIVHHHLNRSGVTRVIINHLKALNRRCLPEESPLQVALLYGGRSENWPLDLQKELRFLDISRFPVGELDYDSVRDGQGNLTRQLKSTLVDAGFGSQETVLHFHNHSLGKNTELPIAVAELAQAGYACLLQIHDFAEDFRPLNYEKLASTVCGGNFGRLPAFLYPQASQIHYAALNRRDHSILGSAGVPGERLHLLPNAIAEMGSLPEKGVVRDKLARHFGIPREDRLLVYPVRGIRRKNLGEALLWSTLADKNVSFALTLAPLNPQEQKSHERWKELAKQLGLKWHFGLGATNRVEFPEVLAAADLILTTSVCEGFGLVFLEAWLAGRQLVGRDLPEITGDFVEAGLRFPALEPGVSIPVDWIGQDKLRCAFIDSFKTVLTSFGRQTPTDTNLQDEFDRLVTNGLVDFAICHTGFQRQIIVRLVANKCDRDHVLKLNPSIGQSLGNQATDHSLVDHNAEIIRREFSLEPCGDRLWRIYQQLASRRRDNELHPPEYGSRVLDSFLNLSHFHPLRVEP